MDVPEGSGLNEGVGRPAISSLESMSAVLLAMSDASSTMRFTGIVFVRSSLHLPEVNMPTNIKKKQVKDFHYCQTLLKDIKH